MKKIYVVLGLISVSIMLQGQTLPGFKVSDCYDEQQMVIEDHVAGTRVLINAPLRGFDRDAEIILVFYALPNGNTIEQTFGRHLHEGDDWHYNIQHIAAQTRYLREVLKEKTIVVAYLENEKHSWPAWKAATSDYQFKVKAVAEEVKTIFSAWDTEVVLNGHSGGGRFIFSYIDAVGTIPDDVSRIAFLDSDYGYEDPLYGPPLVEWLRKDKGRYLCTLAYNDSVVIYNDKPLVSPTGGTWYRSRRMQKYMSVYFRFREKDRDSLIWYFSPGKRIEFVLKTNPDGKIFHTQQVEYNGFIHSMLSGTKNEQRGYTYFGPRVYERYISDTIVMPIRRMNIPQRRENSESGSEFMTRVAGMSREDREEAIYSAIAAGNMPSFLRESVTMRGSFTDTAGNLHSVIYEVLPDYLAVGNDTDYCRVPMNPKTATRIADLFGASLITSKISDHIYKNATVKLAPFNYIPVGNANEQVSKFVDHNTQIERQRIAAEGLNGQLIAGIKKDVILSSGIEENPEKVVIYGWHKSDGSPIQPVYSGHIWWYVDYSHGIRLMNNQVIVDGKKMLLSDILKDPLLYTLFSDEATPMITTSY